jgi:hypothetical protein
LFHRSGQWSRRIVSIFSSFDRRIFKAPALKRRQAVQGAALAIEKDAVNPIDRALARQLVREGNAGLSRRAASTGQSMAFPG